MKALGRFCRPPSHAKRGAARAESNRVSRDPKRRIDSSSGLAAIGTFLETRVRTDGASIQATCHGTPAAPALVAARVARAGRLGPAATAAIAKIHLVAVDIRRRDGRRERKRRSSWL